MTTSNEDLELIAAGFTAIIGFQVVAPHQAEVDSLPKLTIHELFHCTYTPRSLVDYEAGQLFDIHVTTITGATTTIQATEEHTISDVKAAFEIKENIPARNQRLMFDGKHVEDHDTVGGLGIPTGGTLYLLCRGGGPAPSGPGPADFQLDTEELDPPFNYDFTDQKDDGKKYFRGGKVYTRPYGWKRFAVKVLGVYDSDTWLGPGGLRTAEAQGEWPVSYHGTNLNSAKAIMQSGFKVGPRERFGKAVYSSPSIEMVEKLYATKFSHKGNSYKVVLQNRINSDPEHMKVIPVNQTGVGAEYWLSSLQDKEAGVFDLRPYALLFKKV